MKSLQTGKFSPLPPPSSLLLPSSLLVFGKAPSLRSFLPFAFFILISTQNGSGELPSLSVALLHLARSSQTTIESRLTWKPKYRKKNHDILFLLFSNELQ